MSDPNESHRGSRPTDDAGSSEAQHAPEIVDAEIVDETADHTPRSTSARGTGGHAGESGAGRTGAGTTSSAPQDDEEFRQYQQFLEFQKFREWQRQQGESDAGFNGSSGGTTTETRRDTRARSKPWWHYALRALRFRPVRWLIYLLIAFLLVNMLINHFFGDSQDSSTHTGTPGNQDPGLSPVTATTPKDVIIGMNNYLAHTPEKACDLMNDSGKRQFAQGNNAADCTSAARALHAQVTDPNSYAIPQFDENAVTQIPGEAKVSSCQITVEGGPRLGTFGLAQQHNRGWLIDAYVPTCS